MKNIYLLTTDSYKWLSDKKIFCDQYCVDLVVSGMGGQEDSQYDHGGNFVKKAFM